VCPVHGSPLARTTYPKDDRRVIRLKHPPALRRTNLRVVTARRSAADQWTSLAALLSPEPPPPPSQCLYTIPADPVAQRCWRAPEHHGYCQVHVRESPEERGIYMALTDEIRRAKEKLTAAGDEILFRYVINSAVSHVPPDVARDYRALWYRHNYLVSVRDSREPGTPLPAEVTMR
jgi:hypothetical protein